MDRRVICLHHLMPDLEVAGQILAPPELGPGRRLLTQTVLLLVLLILLNKYFYRLLYEIFSRLMAWHLDGVQFPLVSPAEPGETVLAAAAALARPAPRQPALPVTLTVAVSAQNVLNLPENIWIKSTSFVARFSALKIFYSLKNICSD